jgi:hypothetical protein
VKKEFF